MLDLPVTLGMYTKQTVVADDFSHVKEECTPGPRSWTRPAGVWQAA
jgi:hypothetical protein